MEYNQITLKFTGDLEEKYQRQYFKDSIFFFRLAIILAVLVYLIFGYIEFVSHAKYRTISSIIQFALIVPGLSLLFIISYFDFFQKHWQWIIAFGFVFTALGKIILIVLMPESSSYYTGLILIYSAGYFVFRLRFIYATIAGWLTLILFNIGILFFAEISFNTVLINNFYYLALNLFGMLAAYNMELYNRKNFFLSKQLDAREAEELREEVVIAKKAAEFKQNFLANMSHEIRTPLTGLIGMIELLKRTKLDAKQHDYISTLKQSTENLHEIINQVLDYSKIEAGKLKLNIQTFQVQTLLINAKKLFSSICEKDILFEMHVEHEVPIFIKADKNRIMQVINNLISNAVKFTNTGKIILNVKHISTDASNNETFIRIEISDTGLGIRPEKQDQLFVPFAQIDELDTRDYDGTGLGLSICKELVKLHGGEIGFNSEYKVGSTFWFTFKATVAMWDEIPSVFHLDEAFNSTKCLNILLVEDKMINQKVISLLLTSVGHTITLANNGEDALDKYQPGKFDLILMDVQMPVMDGIAATKSLKEQYKDVPPIVGLSANAFEGDSEKYKKLGMDDYITKPLKIETFTEIVNKFF